MSKKNQRPPYKNSVEDAMIDTLEELDAFRNEFMKLTPEIREALKNKAKPTDILKAVSPVAAARLANIAITSSDESKALAAIKDVLDRAEGKAHERREITHRLGEMSDDELDNLLGQEILQVEAMEGDDD